MGVWIDARGQEHQLIVAERDAVVRDPYLGFDRQILAGREVPPELQEAFEAQREDAKPSPAKASRASDTASD